MTKIVNFNSNKVEWRTLLHQTLERENVEAVVMVVRIDDRWCTAWSTESMGGLGMAAMKLFRDVSNFIEEPEC